MGFGEYLEMWQDAGRYGERLFKISDPFFQSIFSEDNLAVLANYFEVATKTKCMHFTDCGCLQMWENVGECGKV